MHHLGSAFVESADGLVEGAGKHAVLHADEMLALRAGILGCGR